MDEYVYIYSHRSLCVYSLFCNLNGSDILIQFPRSDFLPVVDIILTNHNRYRFTPLPLGILQTALV